MDKYHPGYFGKVGMRTFHLKRHLAHCPTINVDRLWSLLPEGEYEKAKAGSDQTPVLDVTKLGYFKVLGKGALPSIPIVVKARYFSKDAEKKIRSAGGAAILTA
jgi:large subunit ribosomal protein L27Ae